MHINKKIISKVKFFRYLFLNIYISQGSVATQLRCGKIFYN